MKFLLFGATLACGVVNPVLSYSKNTNDCNPDSSKTTSKPNVLFIMLDDMCDWTHYLSGHPQAITPNLDSLADEGIWFDNAYAAVPFSNPSRCALLTGLLPSSTGVYNNNHVMGRSPVVKSSTLLPEHFHNNGYETVWAGKIFHTKPSANRLAAIWDDMTHADGGYGPNINQKGVIIDKDIAWKGWQEWTGKDSDFPDVVNTDHIIDFLSSKHEKPFFAALGMYRPHAPYTVPKRFFDMYDLDSIVVPEVPEDDLDDVSQYALENFYTPVCDVRSCLKEWEVDGTWRNLVRAYLASATFSDYNVGRVLKALRDSEYADNTIIIVMGDNGFHHGEKQRFSKMSLWRESCHVPLIVYYPGIAKNREIKDPVSLLDLYPTLCDLCGLPEISTLQGRSLEPLLSDPSRQWEYPCVSIYLPNNCTVHYKNWNFLQYADGSRELYNIEKDEDELKNLASDPAFAEFIKWLASFIPDDWTQPVQ